ncbi:MAG: hypothetical protein ACT6QS_01970 [Flavobacteriales bacterium]
MEHIIAIALGVLSSLIAYILTKKFESRTSENVGEFKSWPFYLGFVCIASSVFALIGLFLSITSLWLNGKRLSGAKTIAYAISFFLSIFALIISSVSLGIDGYTNVYMPYKDNQTEFNSFENDLPILRVNNVTQTPRDLSFSSPEYWGLLRTARLNDTLAFGIYYHNTSPSISRNVHLRLGYGRIGNILICSAALSERFSNNVYLGSCVVLLEDNADNVPVRLDFVGTYWYPEQKSQLRMLPFGQTGEEVMSLNGLVLGPIGPGWENQGSISVRAVLRHN